MFKEPIYFNLYGNWYKGKAPTYYNREFLNAAPILEADFKDIQKEIIDFYINETSLFEPMYVPHQYEDKNWTVFNFYGFLLKYPDNLKKFPVLSKTLAKIPDLVGAQISVLQPHTKIKAHISGSNALIRNHLGVLIPGKYPELGIRINCEERCWEEGKVLGFTESYRHYAWNYSDHARIVLLVDTIHPDYSEKKLWICAASLSVLVLKMLTVKFPLTKKTPRIVVKVMHKFVAVLFMFLLFAQEKLGIPVGPMLQKLKFKK